MTFTRLLIVIVLIKAEERQQRVKELNDRTNFHHHRIIAEMSDGIYSNMIRTKSGGTRNESVEKTVSIYESIDCVSDHDFRTQTNTDQPFQSTESDHVRNRSSRAPAVCLVLLCVLLLTAVTVLCVHIHTKSTNYTEERDHLLNKITNLTEESDQLLNKITNLTEERDELLNNNINLKKENHGLLNQIKNLSMQRDQLNQERHELLKSLGEMGWKYYEFGLYFISSKKKSWTESRKYCEDRGADLIIINSREEQDFAGKMSSDLVWIGLTDSDVENTWKWVDGRTLTSGMWRSGEPNGQKTENCVLIYESGWSDYPCNDNYSWICEKTIQTSH